ncbi:MAG: hypothetical protein KJZ65_09685 [Phycisphaerales bacterium]|nr:hypothetical protein [Phycisphaerales bacterium]
MRLLTSIASVAAMAGAASAQYFTIDFSNQFNDIRNTLVNGFTMPFGPQMFTHGSNLVPVAMSTTGESGFWSWSGYAAAGGTDNPVSLDVPVNLHGVVSVFTLINTYWGNPDSNGLASVTFNATGGLSQTFVLVGGVHIRDYNQNPMYTNTINGTTTQQVFDNGRNQRLDMQRFDLDAAFAHETLTSIVISDYGANNVQRVIVTGITAMVPAPAALPLLAGAGVLGARRRR